jgi:2'-5' RNA ligase superfamily
LLGDADFAWADGLRRQHFPPERNHLRAHLTMFHHLPPSVEAELGALLKTLTQAQAPAARLAGLMNLGRGVAYRIDSEALCDMRAQIAERFRDCLIPQDSAQWRAHVTIQNKASPEAAKSLINQLLPGFSPRQVIIAGLAVWRYLGGPWEAVGAWRFGSGHAMSPPPPLPLLTRKAPLL